MLISVTIIVYNGAAFIEEALQSIYRQTRLPDEIVVWNDGSTDETSEILKGHEGDIRILDSIGNQGAARSRWAVVDAAEFPHVAFLDADDRYHPGALAAFEAAATSSPNADLIFGMMRNFYDESVSGGRPTHGGEWLHARTNGNMLVRKGSFLDASNRAEAVNRSEFISWYQAARKLDLVEAQIDEPIMERRIHRSNASRHPETKLEMMKMLKSHLDEQRRAREK